MCFTDHMAPPGKFLEVCGFQLHVLDTADKVCGRELYEYANVPTVVLEAGQGWHSAMYARLTRALADTCRVIAYDRAGLGWSEDSHLPRDAETIAKTLHHMLRKLGVTQPVWLVGHSIASLYLRVYAGRYPEGVAGMVLLDPSHPMQRQILQSVGIARSYRFHNHLMCMAASMGLARLRTPDREFEMFCLGSLPENAKQQLRYLYSRRQAYRTPLLETDAFPVAAEQAIAAGRLGDIPLLIISGPKRSVETADMFKAKAMWLSLHKDMLSLSSDSVHVVLDEAGHCTLVTEPAQARAVACHIKKFIKDRRLSGGRSS